MADGKIGVGATVGIVLGVTAIFGLGLYFILKPKTASAATPNYVPPPTNASELASLKAQLAALQAQQANSKSLSQQQKDANDAQIQGILIATGGKLLTSGIDSWIKGWNTSGRYNLDTTPVTYDYSSSLNDYSTPTTLSSDLPSWAQDYANNA